MNQPHNAPFSTLSRLAAPLVLVLVTQSPAQAQAAPLPLDVLQAAVPWASMAAPAKAVTNQIDGLSVEELDDGTTVLRVRGNRKPTFNVYRLSEPERLVVDIAGSKPGKVVPHIPLDTWACGRVTVDGVSERDATLVRMVVELKRDASYIVLPRGEELVVTITPRQVAPEAYFAHKSADQRRAEIERSAQDVRALEAEARALSSHAKKQAKVADRKVAEASERATEARDAEIRAKAAERRAAKAEATARTSLSDAKNGKIKLRRALRAAQAARNEAEAERKVAQNQRAVAEQALAVAQRKLDGERKQLVAARGAAEAERDQLHQARGRAEAAEAAANDQLSRAQAKSARAERDAARVLAEARGELERAQSAAKLADTKAKVVLAKAEKEAARAAKAARDADAAAKKKLDAAAAQAAAQLADARKRVTADETTAERKLAEAEAAVRKAEARAKVKLAAANAAQAQAQALLAKARKQAERESSSTEAEARRKADAIVAKAESEAKAKVAAATAAAERKAKRQLAEAEQEAERRLAKAKKSAAAERSAAVRKAERELATLRKQADEDIARKVAAAKAEAQHEADTDLASARAAARAARAQAQAKLRAADATLADAKQTAARKKNSAAALEKQAKAALARAEKALASAEAERFAATSARRQADEALVTAEKRVRKARRRGKLTNALERSLQEAKKAKTEAEGRLATAHKDIEKLRADKGELERTLVQQRATSKALASKIEARHQELARLEKQVAGAKQALGSGGDSVTRQQLAQAKADAAKAKSAQRSLAKELDELRAAAKRAKTTAASADEKVMSLEKSGAGRRALTKAKAEAEAANTRAKTAQSELGRTRARLEEVDGQVREGQAQVALLAKQRKALASEGASLRERNAAAQTKLDEAEHELATLKRSLSAEQNKLSAARTEVEEAQRALDARVAGRHASTSSRPGHDAAAPRRAAGDDATSARIHDVRFEDGKHESRVIVEFDGPVQFEGKTLTPDIQLLALAGATIDPRLERSLDARAYAGPVQRITSFSEDGGAKVLVATRGAATPRLEKADGKLVWHFPHDPVAAAAPRHEVSSVPGSRVGGYAAAPPPPMTAATTAALAAPAPGASRSIGTPRSTSQPRVRGTRWRGERIDIELQDAPIKDVLLLFSDIGGVNIVAGRDVDGSVTMKLNGVPWDQALDIILRSLELGMVREGNVIRVATAEALDGERRAAIEQANARVQLKPLQTRLVPMSYATVDEMIPKVQSVLSSRGTVTPDSRTNTLIIMDVADNIAIAEQLVASLDTQTAQVVIEARIVEARTNFTRQLGIQWGFDFSASPGTGNPTGLLFPNSAGIGGGATGTPVDSRGLVLPGSAANPNYVVDLPAPVGTGAGGALGFSFGSISGNLNTNLRITQAEETGEVRIISAPKIVTLDNSEAQIEQGVQIPISQVSAQGVNTRFVNATLSLRVTPHVTNEGAVLLDVQVQKNEADFINTGARGDPTILTKQARSRMLVNDNDTAVIGGIYTRNKAVNFTKVPWLADIPIVGWFFKSKSEADTRSETLIFLTPKIVNRASSIGG